MSRLPPSPPSERVSPHPSAERVPLDSDVRTTPIHSLLPDIRVPSEPLSPHRYHPVTCVPLDAVEVRSELQQLRKEFSTSVAALKAQEEAAKEVRRRMEEAEEKREQIQKLMERKTAERDMERKVFSKLKKEKDASKMGG